MKFFSLFLILIIFNGCAQRSQIQNDAEENQMDTQRLVDSLVGSSKKLVLKAFGPPDRAFTDEGLTVYKYSKSMGFLSDAAGLDMGYGMAYGTGMSREIIDDLTIYFEHGRVINATFERR